MRDLTQRALDTATASGRRVCRRPGRPPPRRIDRHQDRPGRGRRVRRERGVRGPRPRRRRVGLRQQPHPDDGRGGPGRRRSRPDRTGQRHGPARADAASTTGRRPTARTRRRSQEDPFAVPLERKIADLLAADEAAAGVKGIAFTESMYAAQREWKTFAATDGSFTEQTITHVGSAVEANAVDGDEHQRRSLPRLRRWLAGRRLRVHPRPGAQGSRRAAGRRGRRAADRAAVPQRPVHGRPRPEPALPPGPRELRPPDRARPGLRHRGELRRVRAS